MTMSEGMDIKLHSLGGSRASVCSCICSALESGFFLFLATSLRSTKDEIFDLLEIKPERFVL